MKLNVRASNLKSDKNEGIVNFQDIKYDFEYETLQFIELRIQGFLRLNCHHHTNVSF